jgi:flagellar hook-basal body complex protein FliE
MIKFDPNVGSTLLTTGGSAANGPAQQIQKSAKDAQQPGGFSGAVKALEKYISSVDQMQQSSDMSIQDLLTGRNEDIASVVAAVAKADISFKVLVGVRNKLIDAYKQTMSMQL